MNRTELGKKGKLESIVLARDSHSDLSSISREALEKEVLESRMKLSFYRDELQIDKYELSSFKELLEKALLGQLSKKCVHDINNMLSVAIGNTELLHEEYERLNEMNEHLGFFGRIPKEFYGVLRSFESYSGELDNAMSVLKSSGGGKGELENVIADIPDFLEPLSQSLSSINYLIKFLNNVGRNQHFGEENYLFKPYLNQVVDTSYLLIGKDIEIVKEYENGVANFKDDLITGRKIEMSQILYNLIKNASHAMVEERPKKIAINMKNLFLYDPEIRSISGLRGDSFLKITVRDNGSGMPQDVLEQIFDPYYTTKAKGTGLGLGIVKDLVENYNGHIGVSSELGVGTVFSVYLPNTKYKSFGDVTKNPMRFLFLDDEPVICELMKEYFENRGHSIDVYEKPSLAMESILNGRNGYDGVITDQVFGEGEKTGVEFARDLKTVGVKSPVVVVSGASDAIFLNTIRPHIVRDAFLKPVKRGLIIRYMERLGREYRDNCYDV